MRGGSLQLTNAVVACALFVLATRAGAQDVPGAVGGTVRDSAGRTPLAGAVVLVLDAHDSAVARVLTNGEGRYRATRAPDARRLQVRHLGFRPRTVMLPRDGEPVDVALASVPTLLEAVRVDNAARCPRRADGAVALGLWEQARAALLAAVVAREAAPATLVRLRFDRTLDGSRATAQRVLLDSSSATTVPFATARTAAEFARHGFVATGTDGRATFLAPDADILLDETFARGYCFHVAASDRDRPNEVGLALGPAEQGAGRVEIDGTLWIDTVRRTLRDLEFAYVGHGAALDGPRRGGRLDFSTLANGVLLDRWVLRLPRTRIDQTLVDGRAGVREWYEPHEVGGEVARARWPDGYDWRAPLGTVRLHARAASGAPAAGVAVRLRDTNYEGVTDATGVAEISYLLPGPYAVDVVDAELARIGVAVPTRAHFEAARDTVVDAALDVTTRADFAADGCRRDHQRVDAVRDATRGDAAWLVGRAIAADGAPVEDAPWRVAQQVGTQWREVSAGRTGANGLFFVCAGATRGRATEVRVSSPWRASKRDTPTAVRLAPDALVTIVRVDLGAP